MSQLLVPTVLEQSPRGRAGLRPLLPAPQGPRRVPHRPHRRAGGEPDRRPAPPPRVRRPRQGHQALREQPRRRHERAVRDLRHDAVRAQRHRDDVRGTGGVGGRGDPRGRRARQTQHAPPLAHPHPPAARGCAGAVGRHRDLGARGDRAARPHGGRSSPGTRDRASSEFGPTSTATSSCAPTTPSRTGSSTTSSKRVRCIPSRCRRTARARPESASSGRLRSAVPLIRARLRFVSYGIATPPFGRRIWPVMKSAASDAR